MTDLSELDLHRHGHVDLLGSAWKLRTNITACDAMYVVRAEALDAPMVTCDTPLSRTLGHRARIELIE
jgi:predicted nucleic acid-binding protein